MPSAQYSSFDRGFDVGHRDTSPASHGIIEHELPPREPASGAWKKYIAFAMVAVMVASAFTMILPSMLKQSGSPDNGGPANSEGGTGGTRTVTYEISHIGESYLKPTDYSKLGRDDHSQPGLNEWWTPRINYTDTIIHDSYPYVIAYNGYSGTLQSQQKYKYLTADWTIHSFYQWKMDAENITGLATGATKDPWIVPIMGNVANDGGWVNMSLYQNYLTSQEYTDIQNGVHYANAWYGVNALNYTNQGWKSNRNPNDGWLSEIQGHWDFSRRAVGKFLGLTGAGDLRTQFNTATDGVSTGADYIAWKWRQQWLSDGDIGNPLDIYAAYDYSLFSSNGPVVLYLKLDAGNSTADKLAIWFWSCTWGAEYLMGKYLQQVGIYSNWEVSMEDWYLNGTFGPVAGDIHERKMVDYHMTAWKDIAQSYLNPAWMIEPQHMDYTAERLTDAYISQFDPYYWEYDTNWEPTRIAYTPGVSAYGKGVHYWQTPRNFNLIANERLVVKLPLTNVGWGIEPYASSNATKPINAVADMLSNGMTGEFVLGHGYPSKLYNTTYYDGATKTITIVGPDSFAPNMNHAPAYQNTPWDGAPVYESGSPLFMIDVSPVSHYNLSIVESGPYNAAQTYTLRVVPWDLANAPVRCNQTVELPAISGVTYGTTTHKFGWNESMWNTTIVFASAGVYNLQSRDQYYYLDIIDLARVTVGGVIPEFPTLLIPVIGAVAVFVVFGRRKTKIQDAL